MHELTRIVVSKIINEWEYVAEAFHYDIPTITAIKNKEHGDPLRILQGLAAN